MREAAGGQGGGDPRDRRVGHRPGGLLEPLDPRGIDPRGGEWLGDPPWLGDTEPGEDVLKSILRIGDIECGQPGITLRRSPFDRLALHRHQFSRLLAFDP